MRKLLIILLFLGCLVGGLFAQGPVTKTPSPQQQTSASNWKNAPKAHEDAKRDALSRKLEERRQEIKRNCQHQQNHPSGHPNKH